MSDPKEVIVNDDVEVIEEDAFTPDVEEGQDGIKISVSVEKT